MGNTLPGSIDALVAPGSPIRVASPLGSLEWAGEVDATTVGVFVSGANPTTHDLVDVVLDLDDDVGADRAIRWAKTEHATDLSRAVGDRTVLRDHCMRLAGDPGLAAITIPSLPSMETTWNDWDPGVAAPDPFDLRKAAHCSLIARWLGSRLSVLISPAGIWVARVSSPRSSAWRFDADSGGLQFESGGMRADGKTVDTRYAVIGNVVEETDPSRALAIMALQVAILQEPNDPDVTTWTTQRDDLLDEILPEPT